MARASLSLLLLLAACGGGLGEPSVTHAAAPKLVRAPRLERDLEVTRGALARMQEQGLEQAVLAEIQRLDAESAEGWHQLDGWGLSVRELTGYLKMSGPDADGRVFATDVEREDHPLPILQEITRDLAAHGVTLVVVPVPRRLQIYPDRLPGLDPVPDFAGADVPWSELMVALLEAGVEVIDLLPDFLAARFDESGKDDRLLYLDYDPHWTPRAVEIAAERIAARIRELEGIAAADVDSDVTIHRELGAHTVRCSLLGGVAEVPVWYRRVARENGRPAVVKDPESPIVFLGDSFGGHYKHADSDVMSHIYARTGLRMDVITRDGGAETAWEDLRRSERWSGKRVFVWMFNAGAMSGTRLQKLDLDADR